MVLANFLSLPDAHYCICSTLECDGDDDDEDSDNDDDDRNDYKYCIL